MLASVSAGLYARRASADVLGPASRIESASFWGVATFILESLLFLLVGLNFPRPVDSQGVGVLALGFFIIRVPETKGRSLEQIGRDLGASPSRSAGRERQRAT